MFYIKQFRISLYLILSIIQSAFQVFLFAQSAEGKG